MSSERPSPPTLPTHQAERIRRVESWLRQVAVLRDPDHPLGRAALEQLPQSTGLARESVAWALKHCFEVDTTNGDLAALVAATPVAPHAHVLLSANVFSSALRALALAIASSPRLSVRASRREPVMLELLRLASPSAFELVTELSPNPGDHLWLYGSDATLTEVTKLTAPGVSIHAHGTGYGVVALQLTEDSPLATLAAAVAADIAPFEQRGCLSPRRLLVDGPPDLTRRFALALVDAMSRVEQLLPVGLLAASELAEQRRWTQLAALSGELWPAGRGWVALPDEGRPLGLEPLGRCIALETSEQVPRLLAEVEPLLTTVAAFGPRGWLTELRSVAPRARHVAPGRMQSPPLDGPADRRLIPPARSGQL